MTSISIPVHSTAPQAKAATRTGLYSRLIATNSDTTAMLLRIVLGAVIFPHGAQKLLGWFGGYGFTGTMGFFTGTQHIPYIFGVLAIAAEFFGAIGLVTGLLSRVAALGVASVMAVAALTVHIPNGFFMNWTGQQKGEGFEYHILVFAIAVAVMIKGSGAFSLDRWIGKKIRTR